MISGVIARKLETLDTVLTELRTLGTLDAQQLAADWRTQRAVERDLQILVEIVIDICQRLIALAGQAPAATGGAAIERCIQLGALSRHQNYHKMVQFRNFMVHRYEHVDTAILINIVNHHLNDFELFRDDILSYVQHH